MTSDPSGNLAVSSLTPNQINNEFSNLGRAVNRGFEGSAIAMAMTGAWLPGNKKFALSVNYGNFSGESGLAGAAMMRVSESAFVHAGIGVGVRYGSIGGTVGVTWAW